jgi:uncharacterized protein (TIGR02677 family)
MHEHRVMRTDRSTDLRTLARWFAECQTDADAHRLWRAAFGLAPARHLQVDEETLAVWEDQNVTARESWLEAPPLRISPRLRQAARYVRRGGPNRVIDRSLQKQELAERAREEAQRLAAAQALLATGRRLRLSQLGLLDPVAFGLLLDLLGQVLSRVQRGQSPLAAESVDGSLQIELEPVIDEPAEALIRTDFGTLRGRDYWVTITSNSTRINPVRTHSVTLVD